MAPEDPGNRRQQPRVPLRLPVRFGNEAKMHGGVAVDISEGGMRVVASETLPVNSLVDLFVQFPGHAVRLRAKVVWSGGVGGGPAMGLAFTTAEPSLARAYKQWLAQAKQPAAEQPPADSEKAESKSASPAAAPVPEPTGPVRRHLESPQGQSYEVLLEPHVLGWRLRITQLPHPPGVQSPDHDSTYSTYAKAEDAMRTFVRAH